MGHQTQTHLIFWLDTKKSHLSHSNKVSFCDRSSSVDGVVRPLTIDLIGISSKPTGWILTNFGSNNPLMALFNKCSCDVISVLFCDACGSPAGKGLTF